MTNHKAGDKVRAWSAQRPLTARCPGHANLREWPGTVLGKSSAKLRSPVKISTLPAATTRPPNEGHHNKAPPHILLLVASMQGTAGAFFSSAGISGHSGGRRRRRAKLRNFETSKCRYYISPATHSRVTAPAGRGSVNNLRRWNGHPPTQQYLIIYYCTNTGPEHSDK